MRNLLFLILALPLTIFSQNGKDPIDGYLDAWHKAAAEADAEIFFGSIAEDGVYIGTDASERWDKASFWQFSKPFFDRGKAWDFKPYDRQIHHSNSDNVIWFSELLETWMGVCRGSGILEKENGQWKIKQYHLSVTVPNEIIKDFISLIEKADKIDK